ncbi:MAG: efflux RND transporter permease subunit, partial [Alcanivoracaceae bacterium]
FRLGSSSLLFVFLLGLMVTYLVLAAQFESFVHPFVIMLTVPLALAGGVLGLLVTGNSLNLYSQIGLIMLIGLAAKNGILIVEFANQLRARGRSFEDALQEAARVRLRPVLMTAITTAAGAVPLLVSFGAGAETRQVLGVVIVFGIVVATLFTMLIVPAAYALLTRNTRDPDAVTRDLEEQDRGHPEGGGNTTP